MADSGELSHWSRTNEPKSDPLLRNTVAPGAAALDIVAEFRELIDEHGKLSDDYAALLAQFPGPIPDSPLAVPMQGEDGSVRRVAVEVTESGLRPLPEGEHARCAEAEAHRCSLLAVHQPFVRVYWRPDAAGPAHKAVNEWRARFSAVMKRLRRLYRSLDWKAQIAPDQEAQLHAFPLLRADGATCGISGTDILEAIQTHIEHLASGPKPDPLLLGRVTPGADALDAVNETVNKVQGLIDKYVEVKDHFATLIARAPGPLVEVHIEHFADLDSKGILPPALPPPPATASVGPSTLEDSLIDNLWAWRKEQNKLWKVVASDLGIRPSHLSQILHGRCSISPKLEVKIRSLIANSAAQR